jgi:hypothetical protein
MIVMREQERGKTGCCLAGHIGDFGLDPEINSVTEKVKDRKNDYFVLCLHCFHKLRVSKHIGLCISKSAS